MTIRSLANAYIFLVTVATIALCFHDRQLSFVDKANNNKEAFSKAVCMADGIVVGMSLSLLSLRLFQRISQRKLEIEKNLEEIAGSFALYSVTVGTILCIIDIKSLTTLQICMYIFVSIAHIHAVVRFFRKAKHEDTFGDV